MSEPFNQIAAILAIAAIAGWIATRLRQPVLLAFIAVGIAVGPSGFGWVQGGQDAQVEVLSRLGIAVLLFLVGLKLDLHLVRATGPVAVVVGAAQVLATVVLGFGIATALGFSTVEAVYISVGLAFSSTIIIVKLLGDKRELDQLHGRIAIGVLIVQDIVVIVAMIVVTTVAAGEGAGFSSQLAGVAIRGLGFLLGLGVIMRWVLPAVLPRIAASRELLLLSSVAWAVAVSAIGDALGLSREVGAFLAGFALASTPYREAIGTRLVALRDFLLLFFFIQLGSEMHFEDSARGIVPAVALSVLVLIGKPVTVMLTMRAMRYHTKVSAPVGLSLAQISEFSLILVALGVSSGHVGSEVLTLVTQVGLVTIALSTYLILHPERVVSRLGPVIRLMQPKHPREIADPKTHVYDVLVVGAGRYGRAVLQRLRQDGVRALVIDFDPQALSACRALGAATLYGDAEDPELISSLPLHRVRWVISTVPDVGASAALIHGLETARYEGGVALTAHTADDAERLSNIASDARVLSPFEHGVEPVAELVCGS